MPLEGSNPMSMQPVDCMPWFLLLWLFLVLLLNGANDEVFAASAL